MKNQARRRKLKKYYSFAILLTTQIAFAAGANPIKEAIGTVAGVMGGISFLVGLADIWSGAKAKKRGDTEAYNSIIAGLWYAGGGLMLGAIYSACNMGAAIPEGFGK